MNGHPVRRKRPALVHRGECLKCGYAPWDVGGHELDAPCVAVEDRDVVTVITGDERKGKSCIASGAYQAPGVRA